MIVSTFGLTFYEWRGVLQKPFKVYLYEDIIGISISSTQMRLHVANVEKQFRIILNFQMKEKPLQCYMDVISYMVLRTNEYIRPLYAYNELYKMMEKENIFINENPNRNRVINYIFSELAKKEQSQHSGSSFFQQINKVTKRGQLQEQLASINQKYFKDEKLIQMLIKKHLLLIEEAAKVGFNTLMYKHFPFHIDCPLLSRDRERTVKQIDVSKYFLHPKFVKDLFDPKRDKFGKAIIPYDVSSDTSNSPLKANPKQP